MERDEEIEIDSSLFWLELQFSSLFTVKMQIFFTWHNCFLLLSFAQVGNNIGESRKKINRNH